MSESRPMVVTGFVRDDGACGYYRVRLPLDIAGDQGLFTRQLIPPGADPSLVIKHLGSADVVVIPRPYDDNMLELMRRLKKNGVKVVVDHDDNMFHISPWSDHYKEFGLAEVKVDLNGEIKPLWTDGVNIDLKENQARIDGFKRSLELCDMVTVTQPILADVYRAYNPNVVSLPNCLDGNAWQSLPLKKDGRLRLLWSGGSSHYQDVYLLKDVLPAICKRYPEVQVMVMGCTWKAVFGEIPPDQYVFLPWVHTEAYPYRQAALNTDIALIPLEANEFNSCKSNIKLLEQSFLGVPSVVSMTSPYQEFYNGENMVMVGNDSDSWYKGISALVDDALLRAKMGGEAQRKARAAYDIHTQAELWAQAYHSLAAA